MNVGDVLICVSNDPLEGNDKAPPLVVGAEYTILEIILDSKGNQHFNVGISSDLEYVRSWETKEELPRGDKIHWCHPSRFKAK